MKIIYISYYINIYVNTLNSQAKKRSNQLGNKGKKPAQEINQGFHAPCTKHGKRHGGTMCYRETRMFQSWLIRAFDLGLSIEKGFSSS